MQKMGDVLGKYCMKPGNCVVVTGFVTCNMGECPQGLFIQHMPLDLVGQTTGMVPKQIVDPEFASLYAQGERLPPGPVGYHGKVDLNLLRAGSHILATATDANSVEGILVCWKKVQDGGSVVAVNAYPGHWSAPHQDKRKLLSAAVLFGIKHSN